MPSKDLHTHTLCFCRLFAEGLLNGGKHVYLAFPQPGHASTTGQGPVGGLACCAPLDGASPPLHGAVPLSCDNVERLAPTTEHRRAMLLVVAPDGGSAGFTAFNGHACQPAMPADGGAEEAFGGPPPAMMQRRFKPRALSQDPAVGRGMIHRHSARVHRFFAVAIAQRVGHSPRTHMRIISFTMWAPLKLTIPKPSLDSR